MKNIVLALILVVTSQFAFADVALQFDEIRLAPLSRLILGDVAKVPFALSSDVIADHAVVTIQTDKLNKSVAVSWLRDVVKPYGFDVIERGGLYTVQKSIKEVERGEEVFIYRPSHRSMSYLMDVCKSFITGGRWSTDRPSSLGAAVSIGNPGPRAASEPVPVQGSAGAQTIRDADVIVYEGSRLEVQRLRGLLQQIDVPAPQVVIQATLYEVSNIAKDASAIGIAGEILGGRLGVNLGSVAAGPWSFAASIGGVKAVFSALASDTRFKALARPNLRLSSGAKGRVSVGDETPILGSVTTTQGGAIVQSVEYRPSGHILDVMPVILDKGVELTIDQQSSSFVQTTTGVDQSPTLLKRQVSTRVMVEPGSFVVLGGMQETRSGSDVSGPKWLPEFMNRKSADRSETELLLVLYVEKV